MSNEKKVKSKNDIKSLYGRECTLSKDDFIKTFDINEHGLSSQEAQDRINKYGLNQVSSTKPKRWYNYFLESLFSPFNSILLRYSSYFILYRCLPCR